MALCMCKRGGRSKWEWAVVSGMKWSHNCDGCSGQLLWDRCITFFVQNRHQSHAKYPENILPYNICMDKQMMESREKNNKMEESGDHRFIKIVQFLLNSKSVSYTKGYLEDSTAEPCHCTGVAVKIFFQQKHTSVAWWFTP